MKMRTIAIGVCALGLLAGGAGAGEVPAGTLLADCRELRAELRAFYPKYGQFSGPVKDPRQKESCDRIEAELRGWMAEHPRYDALDLRRETYLLMQRHFVPFVFTNSPFYFEAGINGGWSGCCPARLVNKYCHRFYREQGLVPQAAFDRLYGRMNERSDYIGALVYMMSDESYMLSGSVFRCTGGWYIGTSIQN